MYFKDPELSGREALGGATGSFNPQELLTGKPSLGQIVLLYATGVSIEAQESIKILQVSFYFRSSNSDPADGGVADKWAEASLALGPRVLDAFFASIARKFRAKFVTLWGKWLGL